jgi:hypothetical protein
MLKILFIMNQQSGSSRQNIYVGVGVMKDYKLKLGGIYASLIHKDVPNADWTTTGGALHRTAKCGCQKQKILTKHPLHSLFATQHDMKGTFVHGYSVELELAICWTGIITSVMYYFWSIQLLFLDGQKRSTVYRTKHCTKSNRVSPGAPVQESKRKPLYRAAQESPLCVSSMEDIEQRGTRALSME